MNNGAPLPSVIYVGTNGECATCPNCKTNVMIKQRKCSKWTYFMVCCGSCVALGSDYSW